MSVVRSYNRGEHFRISALQSQGRREGGGSGAGSNDGGCSGESEMHHKMKAIAYARLENDYPEATIELESNLEGAFLTCY